MELMELTQSVSLSSDYPWLVKQLWSDILSLLYSFESPSHLIIQLDWGFHHFSSD